MLSKFVKLKKIQIILMFVCGILYVSLVKDFNNVSAFDAAVIVEKMGQGNTTVFEDVRESLKNVIEKWGVQAALDVNAYAFLNNKYGIYNCHVLTHLIGHEAVAYYGTDFESVLNSNIQFCEMGYLHGAEAQVALSGGNYQDELYRMCDLIQLRNPTATCFHGAGHAFMNDTFDANKALSLCDDLINEQYTVEDMFPCYNSVFAELTNLVGGTDGATGMEYTGGPPLVIEESTSLEYCTKFGERYKIECLFEFSGLGISEASTDADIEKKLLGCTNEDYDEVLEAACIRSVSAVGAQHQLAFSNTIAVPSHIFTLSEILRNSYIDGAGTEMSQYIISGVQKDWQTFCMSFIVEVDQQKCTRIFIQIE